MYKFTPIGRSFRDEPRKAEYVLGLQYLVRPEDEYLIRQVPKWIEQGKVEKIAGSTATVNGAN